MGRSSYPKTTRKGNDEMFGIFNQKNSWKSRVQLYNVAISAAILYELNTNPRSSWRELGPDLLVHTFSALSLRENASAVTKILLSLLNAARIGSIYSEATSGSTAMSDGINGVEVANHLVNIVTLIIAAVDEAPNNEAPRPH